MNILALDIGGANIKAAHSNGQVWSRPVAIRADADYLARQFKRLDPPMFDHLAVTMTAELCDCFESKQDGVQCITRAVKSFATGRPAIAWAIDQPFGQFVEIDQADQWTMSIAAANWHVLATWIGRTWPDERVLLIDCGSTTTDIVPIDHGTVISRGNNDYQRLRESELIYRGVLHTPVMSLGSSVYWQNSRVELMSEPFAMTRDVYMLTGDLPEQPDNLATPDGKPATAKNAARRLIRMVGGDMQMFNDVDAIDLAEILAGMQEDHIALALRYVVRKAKETGDFDRFDRVVVAGLGEFLAQRVADEVLPDVMVSKLSDQFDPEISQAAPAYSLLMLAEKYWDLSA